MELSNFPTVGLKVMSLKKVLQVVRFFFFSQKTCPTILRANTENSNCTFADQVGVQPPQDVAPPLKHTQAMRLGCQRTIKHCITAFLLRVLTVAHEGRVFDELGRSMSRAMGKIGGRRSVAPMRCVS